MDVSGNANAVRVCKYCGRQYKTAQGYERHVQAKHPDVQSSSTVGCETRQGLTASSVAQPLLCSVCNRQYKTVNGLRRHELSHQSQGTSEKGTAAATQSHDSPSMLTDSSEAEAANQRSESNVETGESDLWPELPNLSEDWAEIEDSAVACLDLIGEDDILNDEMSTDCEPPRKKRIKDSTAQAKSTLVKCSECGQRYTTITGYLNHRTSHELQGAVNRIPPLKDLKEQYSTITNAVLDEIHDNTTDIGSGGECLSYCEQLKRQPNSVRLTEILDIVCEYLYKCFTKRQTFNLPSHIREKFLRVTQELLVDPAVREVLFSKLEEIVLGSKVSLNIFLASFLRRFANKLLVYILQRMVNRQTGTSIKFSDMPAETSQSTTSLDFKQTMHFIGGSNIKSVVRRMLTIKNRTPQWERLMFALQKYFLVSDFSDIPEDKLTAWTEAQDYGKLFKISNSALEFFLELGKGVKVLEHADGSLKTEECVQTVLNTPELLALWDDILKGILPEQESLTLLNALCYHFCVTWRNGIIARRLEAIRNERNRVKPGTSGVSFRAHLA